MASGPSSPLSDLEQDSPVKRRTLTYVQHDDVVYAIRELAARGGPLKDLIKPAARKWADDRSESIGAFSQPRKLPNAEPTYFTSAFCGKCDGCWSNAGKVYRFEASIQQAHFLRLWLSALQVIAVASLEYAGAAPARVSLVRLSQDFRSKIVSESLQLVTVFWQRV